MFHYLVDNRFFSILLPVMVLLMVQPLVADQLIPGWVTRALNLLILLGAYRVLRVHRLAVVLVAVFLVIAAVALPADLMRVGWSAHIAGTAAMVAAMVIIVLVIAWEAVTEDWINSDTLLGAVAVYLLIGLTATHVYEFIELNAPGAFTNLHWTTPPQLFAELNYYSLVTLTTLGYGDIAPVNPFARVLGTMEAILGQFFVAAVVGLLISRGSRQRTQRWLDAATAPTTRRDGSVS